MELKEQLDAAISKAAPRPKAVRVSVPAFRKLEEVGAIERKGGGPLGLVEWAENVPFFAENIFVWCDPSFEGDFQLPPS